MVLILKTAREREFSLGSSRQVKQPQALEFGLKIHFEPYFVLPHKKVWKVHTDWLWTGFSPPLLPGCHGTFSRMLVSQHPWQVLSATLSRTSGGNANSWTTGEVLDLRNESSVVECLPTASAPRRSPEVSQNGPLVLPNVACPDVFQSARVLKSRHILARNLATYTIQDCVTKNHVHHISGPCLKLKILSSRDNLKSQMANWWFHLLPLTT